LQGDAENSPFALPHVYTFTSVIGSAWRTYFQTRYDEAMRHGREEARMMLNDAFLRGLIQERMLATASLKWHLEIDNMRDKRLIAVKDGLTQIIKSTPKLGRLIYYLLWAIWYGRYGAQVVYEWRDMNLPSPENITGGESDTQNLKPTFEMERRRALR